MNREILFKAKRKDNGEWVEGSLVSTECNSGFIFRSKTKAYAPKGTNIFCSTKCYEIDPITLCQYTGLTDKNGKKIWENDIVTITLECDDYLIPSETGIVEYSYGQYELKVKAPDGQEAYSNLINKLSEAPFEIEKLGNVFDNPELLEV